MEVSRFRILFLSLLAVTVLPGCSLLGGRDDDRTKNNQEHNGEW